MATETRCPLSPKMPAGLDLEVCQNPLTLKTVVNLVVAMERFKGSRTEKALSRKLSGESFLNIMIDDIIEVIHMPERRAPVNQFTRTGEYQCTVSDSQNKSLVLLRDSMELQAVTLQGGSSHRKVQLNMSTYVHPSPSIEARPVALGIKGSNLYMSCHQEGDRPTLHLEPVEDRQSLMAVASESDMLRFLFYKRDSGVSLSTLTSARFPNWYISTAEEENMPVEMCQRTAKRYLTFHIQRHS
ncbi:interleukin-1 beta [Syngnathoides biaculeatus]|uniref:interleukin-1 beta n=1 Tax=Syngnathoides biaculeatus TaxID=300417 RepID=UPI002ADDFCA8|nr:interleukin-1 beta [Syngnathoides biaculeatus]